MVISTASLSDIVQKAKKLTSDRIKLLHYRLGDNEIKIFKHDYKIEKEIGKGGFGTVYSASRLRDKLPVAVKFIERNRIFDWGQVNEKQVPMEIVMLVKTCNVQGVVKMLQWFSIPDGFLIIMERPTCSIDLYSLLSKHGPLSEMMTLFLFKQIVNTAAKCLELNILHRDIKDENIVIDLDTGKTILVDFGAATVIEDSKTLKFQGTRLYCPPEWYTHSIYLGPEATIWSLGVVLYSMLNQQLPFLTERDVYTNHLFGPLPKLGNYSKDVEDLVNKCLHQDPEQRMKLTELIRHEWIQREHLTWDKIYVPN
ncbi:unnamed protein product [Bursaphelenchus okinawaensis]|uniref:Serine/threonine-protein kinase pim-1 n=1 Tax=Bursaphelenchus okinawaensis TaxID=465554 RepID=A0A811KJI5_9BILA|nr:unnamed protein product [Bursaphelenchus okinawaensis]CAG9105029.1 unnamed protein product [Bursaphelenchus okinawaensis]